MAKIFYELKQNTNDKSLVKGQWYAYARTVETLNTRKIANHIAEHGSIYTSDVVLGVLEKWRHCLVEMLLESKRVKIDGLGTFYCTIENKPGGADSEKDFSISENMLALHIRFIPEQEQEMNISSREFIKKASFINVKSFIAGNSADSEDAEDNPDDIDDGDVTGDNTGDNTGNGGENTGNGSGNTGDGGNTGNGGNSGGNGGTTPLTPVDNGGGNGGTSGGDNGGGNTGGGDGGGGDDEPTED